MRKTRDVQLTAAGCVFVAKARDVLQQTKFALQSAAAASRNEGKDWIVGYSPLIDPSIFTKLRDAEGPVRSDIVLTSAYTTIQIEQLLAGRLGWRCRLACFRYWPGSGGHLARCPSRVLKNLLRVARTCDV